MPSHLTRSVFRRILANQPISHQGCLRREARRCLSIDANTARPLGRRKGYNDFAYEQKRTFLNFNIFSKKQEAVEANIAPGVEKMMELAKKERMQARMPPIAEAVKAFSSFFKDKSRRREAVTDTQAQLALQTLRYVSASRPEQKVGQEEGDHDTLLSIGQKTLGRAAKVLRSTGTPPSDAHVELSRLIYSLAARRNVLAQGLLTYVSNLSETGALGRGREVVLEFEAMVLELDNASSRSVMQGQILRESVEDEDMLDEDSSGDVEEGEEHLFAKVHGLRHAIPKVWPLVLRGFANQNDYEQVQSTLDMMRARDILDNRETSRVMLDYSIRNSDSSAVKHWWNLYWTQNEEVNDAGLQILAGETTRVLKWCLRHNELEVGRLIVKNLMATNPPKPLWDAILVWAAGTKNSVDEIDRMMSVMEKSNLNIQDRSQWRVPDIATINGLVEFATEQNDPYMAERFIALGRDRDIEPDAKTLVLQMEYRLSVNDVDGALIAYKNLQSKDLSSNEDITAVNRLIVALCQSKRHDFDTIMNVAADLSDRRARFDPTTVSALSILHLGRDERDDVIDLLNTHAYHYSSTERQKIRDTIIAFCLELKTPTSRAWQGYQVLKTIFDEMPRSERTDLMKSFLDRDRADMGVHVFQNMRMHSRADTIPTVDTYVAAFMGLAKLRDLENLEVVHNLLKLDYNINTSTYLHNSLMIAYTACGKSRFALKIWDDIVASREGPSYNSIHAALRACEKAAWGDLRAQDLWATLRKRNVELDQHLWASYVAALAGNGDTQLAITTMEAAAEKDELEIEAFTLGSLFAAAAGQVKQAAVEEYGKEKYPEEWRKLEALGVDADENGMRAFRIDRKVGP